jgi:hypothetical protein
MSKFAVIAFDPQVDLYHESDFYGAEVVECDDERDALVYTDLLKELIGLQIVTVRVKNDTPLGWRDDRDWKLYEGDV